MVTNAVNEERLIACPKCETTMQTVATLCGSVFVFTGWQCPECKHKIEAREAIKK